MKRKATGRRHVTGGAEEIKRHLAAGAHKMFYSFRSTTAFVISSTQIGIGPTRFMSTIFRSKSELALSIKFYRKKV